MAITALPDAPSRSDPTNFATEADAWVAAMDTFTDEANALATALNLSIPVWITKTAAYTAVNGDNILCDTSGGAFTITMPLSPSAGETVRFADGGHAFVTYNLTIGRNSQNIMGAAANMTVSVNYEYFMLVFSGATLGWILAE